MIEQATKTIVDKVLDVGDGDIVNGLVKAHELGLIDIPFTYGKIALGKCLAIRDFNRTVRFLNYGNIPLTG